MIFTGEATSMGTSLELAARGAPWAMTIRRTDGKNDALFPTYNGQPLTGADVLKFLPSWQELTWQRITASMFSNSVSCAEDGVYAIDLSATRDSTLSHDDVIAAFEAFMAAAD